MLEPIELFNSSSGPIRYLMAPMSGITDTVFRLLIREMGSQVVVSDLISAEGIVRGGEKTLDMLAYSEGERPIGIQLFGACHNSLVEACRVVEQTGVDFIDLNLGCPVKKVVKKGGGAAWLQDTISLGKLLYNMKQAITIPLTIKVRTGWDASSINVREVVQVAANSGVSWVAIHGRTRAQAYDGVADWELIREVAQDSPLPIIGNGDIVTAEQAREKIEKGYANAVMIGRGALKNPWIFQELRSQTASERDFSPLIQRHFELALAKKDERRAFVSLRKFFGWYASGMPNAGSFRRRLFEISDASALKDLAYDYFGTLDPAKRVAETQPFLMGGHG